MTANPQRQADRGRPRDASSGGDTVARLVVGRVGRAHGIKGELTVEVRTDDPEGRFGPGAVLLTDPPGRGPLTVATARWHSARLLLRFEGVEDRTAAEGMRGTMLLAEATAEEVLDDPEEFYDHQLVGLTVVTADGERIGTVHEMIHLPVQDLIAIRRPDGAEVLVPFVAEIVPTVDVAGGRVVIQPPPGLLDLGEDG